MIFYVDNATEISLARDLRWFMIEVFSNVMSGGVVSIY